MQLARCKQSSGFDSDGPGGICNDARIRTMVSGCSGDLSCRIRDSTSTRLLSFLIQMRQRDSVIVLIGIEE